MDKNNEHILIWLPSPLGDAVMCTPALRAIRQRFPAAKLTLLANPVVQAILSPSPYANTWLSPGKDGLWAQARRLRREGFTQAILCKNSLGSALTCALAGIPTRIGYAREGRSLLLTERLYPPRLPNGRYRPHPMIDYYLALAHWLGAEVTDHRMSLSVDPQAEKQLLDKLPAVATHKGPLVILVPGGAFGPSKCWPLERYAQTADQLQQNHQATIVLSVAPNKAEQDAAATIADQCKRPVINLGQHPLGLGELKALYACADLVITNDTGPRHIAIALQRKIVTLFGPNDPAWTQTGWEREIQIIGRAPCVPCQQPTCRIDTHLCMESISVDEVVQAAEQLL